MKLLVDFFPIILFFIGYYQANFLIENTFIGQLINSETASHVNAAIIATGIALIANFFQILWTRFRHHRIEKMHLFSFMLFIVLGGTTILLADPTFLMWKPTAINWLFAVVFFTSFFVGEKNLIERAMGNQIELPEIIWTRLNMAWVVFFIISGAANYYVAFHYALDLDAGARMDIWVNFKLFGLMGLTLVFIILQAIYLTRHIIEEDEAIEETIEHATEQEGK